MNDYALSSKFVLLLLLILVILSGCTTTLLKDDGQWSTDTRIHCSGGEWIDDSSIAVLPIPVVAFFVPHADLHEVKGAAQLNQCGDPTQVVNREVTVSRTACIPAGLSRIITLGIWQWCPAHIEWEADVIQKS